MNTYAMGIAMKTAELASMPKAAGQNAAATDGVDFNQLLTAMTGVQTQAADQQSGAETQGLTWRDIQSGMMYDALQTISQAERPMPTDPVLAQLMEMLQGLSASEDRLSGDNLREILALIERMQQRLQEILDEEGTEMAAQQAMALLGAMVQEFTGMPMPAEMTTAMAADGGSNVLQLMLNSKPEDLVQMLADGKALQNEGVQLFEDALKPTEPTAQVATAVQTEAVGETESGTDVVQVQTAKAPQAATVDFESAVRTAKQQLAETSTAEAPKEELDIDALQQRVDAGVYLQNTPLANAQQPEVAEAPRQTMAPMELQLAEGIATAIAEGKEEIVITLKPVELGEVVIRLSETDAGMMLNIIAKNPETQRALAQQAELLQDNLRPLKVEVESIVTERQYELLSGQQNFGGQHHRSFNEMHGAAYYGDKALGEHDQPTISMVQQAMAAAPSTALDAYV